VTVAAQVLVGIAALGVASIYGTDLFALIVLRSALTHLDTAGLTATMGRVHQYGDRRMPVPFAIGAVATVGAIVVSALAGQTVAAICCGVALLAQVAWIGIFFGISEPVNRRLTTAALAGESLSDARQQQDRWDRVLPARWGVDLVALAALGFALAVL
jgi:hypothetical protein